MTTKLSCYESGHELNMHRISEPIAKYAQNIPTRLYPLMHQMALAAQNTLYEIVGQICTEYLLSEIIAKYSQKSLN